MSEFVRIKVQNSQGLVNTMFRLIYVSFKPFQPLNFVQIRKEGVEVRESDEIKLNWYELLVLSSDTTCWIVPVTLNSQVE